MQQSHQHSPSPYQVLDAVQGRPTLPLGTSDHGGSLGLWQREARQAVEPWVAPDSAWGRLGGLPRGGTSQRNRGDWPEWAVGVVVVEYTCARSS